MSRIILHSDCNCFYASVECALNPALKGKPVAVSGNPEKRHGIILTKSEEAKKFGVKTGETIWQAKKKCPQLITLPPNFSKYVEYSKRVKEIYYKYTDMVESFGLDEAWLDVTGSTKLFGNGYEIAQQIRNRIKKELDITVSIGVSYNKIFAKLGSDYKKPDAVTLINKSNYKHLVWSLPAEDLLYVGSATKKKLNSLGIFTIGQIANTPADILKKNLGKWGQMLHSFANGNDTSTVALYGETSPVKSIGNSTTSPRDLKDITDVKIIMGVLADSVARRMREQGLSCMLVSITVRDSKLYSFTRQKKLLSYTDITSEILNTALALFKENYSWKNPIRSLGLSVSELTCKDSGTQLSLFEDNKKRLRQESLDKTTDALKNRFGNFIINPAVMLKDTTLSGFNPKADHTIHPVALKIG
ncbi:DNA polymerase IV [Oscillospiraceae bacterium LCP25S3_E10]|nr:DNA polymerase IV [Ruminococcus sp.]MDD6447723.1 DNA polymerase IV [Ruminococcus sp.]MDY2857008.1 DNA polymerase IV [Oscillospiraceae bacterium]